MPIVVWAKNLLRFGALRGTLLDNDKSPALDRAAHQPGTGMEATSADARRNDRYATRQGAYVHRGQALGWGVIDDGPVKIESDVPIVAAERVIYKVNGIPTSFSEMMGLPDALLSTSYYLPWYNNIGLDTQLRFGVP
jgi:hypothetical protein